MWKNRETMLIRAPEGHLAVWEAILNVIQNSGRWNLKWVADEVNNQRRRAGQIIATQQEIQAVEKVINDNRINTYTEINKDMYLTLTGQDEFTNPFSGQPEIDTNAWDRRWLDETGNVIYTNDANYNPNTDPDLNISGFKLSLKRR
jgi:hypothetical protein